MLKRLMTATMIAVPFGALLLQGCDSGVSYTKQIQPIIAQRCGECHLQGGQGQQKSGFLVESHTSLMKGTKHGPVIVPGDSLSSSLYRLVAGKVDKSIRMPHSREPLTEQQIALIERWIDEGAKNN